MSCQLCQQTIKETPTYYQTNQPFGGGIAGSAPQGVFPRDGQSGYDGKSGRDGQSGRDGKYGNDGKNGIDGKKGIDGKNGIDGKLS